MIEIKSHPFQKDIEPSFIIAIIILLITLGNLQQFIYPSQFIQHCLFPFLFFQLHTFPFQLTSDKIHFFSSEVMKSIISNNIW